MIGIRVAGEYDSTSTVLTVDRTYIAAQTGSGIYIEDKARAFISNSEIHSSYSGVGVSNFATAMLDHCKLMDNTIGIHVFSSGTVRLAGTTISGSKQYAIHDTNPDPILSFGNNHIVGNIHGNGTVNIGQK